jgi:hypothetical protein
VFTADGSELGRVEEIRGRAYQVVSDPAAGSGYWLLADTVATVVPDAWPQVQFPQAQLDRYRRFIAPDPRR